MIELSVRLDDDASILEAIEGLPTDAKIDALGSYGATKAKGLDAAAVSDAISRNRVNSTDAAPGPSYCSAGSPSSTSTIRKDTLSLSLHCWRLAQRAETTRTER